MCFYRARGRSRTGMGCTREERNIEEEDVFGPFFFLFFFSLRPVVYWSRSSLPAKYVCVYVRHTVFESRVHIGWPIAEGNVEIKRERRMSVLFSFFFFSSLSFNVFPRSALTRCDALALNHFHKLLLKQKHRFSLLARLFTAPWAVAHAEREGCTHAPARP